MPSDAQPPGPDEDESDKEQWQDESDEEQWEDILSLRVHDDSPDEKPGRPVRLSSLRPPGKAVPTAASSVEPQDQMQTETLPLHPVEGPDAGGGSSPELTPEFRELERQRELEREIARRLSESEQARHAAEARLTELERELADLRAQMAYEREATRRIAAGAGPAETEKLRAELAEAREIIRAMEEAYLAGERFSRNEPSE